MNPPIRFCALALSLLLPVAAAGAGGKAFDLEDLAWIAGVWGVSDTSNTSEEFWVRPLGGAMLGLHRDVREGRMVSFEYLRIEQREDGIFYVASPQGRSETSFRLVELVGTRAVFENLEHDFPQRIIYRLGDDGALQARIEGPRAGKTASMEWTWPRRGSLPTKAK